MRSGGSSWSGGGVGMDGNALGDQPDSTLRNMRGEMGTGGGGGGSYGDRASGNGGGGVVALRYPIGQITATAKATGGNVIYYQTPTAGKIIHSFTTSAEVTLPAANGPLSIEYVICEKFAWGTKQSGRRKKQRRLSGARRKLGHTRRKPKYFGHTIRKKEKQATRVAPLGHCVPAAAEGGLPSLNALLKVHTEALRLNQAEACLKRFQEHEMETEQENTKNTRRKG